MTVLVAAAALPLAAAVIAAEAGGTALARWLFDEGSGLRAGDGVDGAVNGSIQRATWSEGRSGGALVFEDYSLIDYLKPDVSKATRVTIPHHDRLNPPGGFTLIATIQPSRDPAYYGGIVEKGRGYGASYRLLLLRGLRVRATLGDAGDVVTSASALGLGAWHEIRMTYDGSSLVLEIDGKEAGQKSGVKAAMSSKADVVIGERFSGKIDRVELHSR